ncbi:MAG: hypothetical protein A2014_01535 [Spirochaetes bacterium GWF1_49_6]|nr:MAG: hypothetical protein A2014_01535 [Spirochaetes bacterium GWF1_49_6]
MMIITVFTAAFTALLTLGSCADGSSDFSKAKAELDELITSTCKVQNDAVKTINSSTNIEEILGTIKTVIDAKKGIDPGIDRISKKYPNLNQEEVDKILTYMGEKVLELTLSSDDFVQAVDGAIRNNLADENKTKPLIIALQEYQTLGQ